MEHGCKKRKKKECVTINTDEEKQTTVVKCSLSSIQTPLLHTALEGLAVYVNQVRVLMTLVVKEHLFRHLHAHADLPMLLDQNYISKVLSVVRGLRRRGDALYVIDVAQAFLRVLDDLQIPPPVYTGPLSNTALSIVFCSVAKFYVVNIITHLNMHGHDSIQNWYNNHLRLHLTSEEQLKSRAPMARLGKVWKETPHPLFQKQQALQETWGALLTVNEKLIFVFRLRQEVEALLPPKGVTLKHMAVVPEAHLRLSPVVIDDLFIKALAPTFVPIPSPEEAEPMMTEDRFEETAKEEQEVNPLNAWIPFVHVGKIQALKRTGVFNRYLTTDGVAANITYVRAMPLSEDTKGEQAVKKARIAAKKQRAANKEAGLAIKVPRVVAYKPAARQLPLPKGEYAEDTIEGIPATLLNYVGVDPGRRTMLSAVAMSNPNLTLQTDAQVLKRETGSTARKNATQRHINQLGLTRVLARFYREAVTKKTVTLADLQTYRQVLGRYWQKLWQCYGAKRYCQIRFQYFRRRTSYMERMTSEVVNHFTVVTPDQSLRPPILLFGAGGTKGGFGYVRGVSGVNGPLVETRKRLARKCTLIMCSEFRTSMCCGECGRKLQHPRNPLTGQIDQSQSFCLQPNHSAIVDRDLDAARKIACRFVRQQRGESLGPWQNVTVGILDDPEPSSRVVTTQPAPHRLFL